METAMELEGEIKEILTGDDVHFLAGSPEFQRFLLHLGAQLGKCREEADSVTPSGLPALQGRIAAIKDIIRLF